MHEPPVAGEWRQNRAASASSGVKRTVTSAAVSPDGKWLATTGEDATLRLWRPATGQPVTAVRVTEPLNSCVWHKDGTVLVAVGRGGVYAFQLRDAATDNL